MAQTPAPKPPPTYEQVIVSTWKNLHNKILTMAKDTVYPDAKLGYKPHPDSRSVHRRAASRDDRPGNDDRRAKGEKYDFGAKEKEYAGAPQTRAAVVEEMEAAIAASFAVVDAPGSSRCRADRLARAPGRALRQAGDVVSRERRRAAYFPPEVSRVVSSSDRAAAFARFQLAW